MPQKGHKQKKNHPWREFKEKKSNKDDKDEK